MPTSRTLQRLLRLAVLVLAPTLGCSGWYALNDLDTAGSAARWLALLAYPLALLAVGSAIAAWLAHPGSRIRRLGWLATACLALPLLVVTVLRL